MESRHVFEDVLTIECAEAVGGAQWAFIQTNRYPDLIGFNLIKTVEDERMMRLVEYLVPAGDGHFWHFSDSKLHLLR